MTAAALILLQAGERGKAVLFFAELGKRLDATELSQLGALLAEMDEPYFEVLLGQNRRDARRARAIHLFPTAPTCRNGPARSSCTGAVHRTARK